MVRMSHFTTLVIVNQATDPEDAEAQATEMLAPFDENTEVEPYKNYQEGEPADYWGIKALKERRLLEEPVTWASIAAAANVAWGGTGERYEVDELGMYGMSTYNPKSKWDWYSLGGRWGGFFMVKAGVNAAAVLGEVSWTRKEDPPVAGTADLLQKRDVDFEMMRRENEIQAEERWGHWRAAVAAVGEEALWDYLPWRTLLDNHPDDIDTARQIYHAQPIIKYMRQTKNDDGRPLFGFGEGPEDFFYDDPKGHERFIQTAINRTAVPFAVLDSEGWHEKGSMGWFAMVSNEMDQDDWNALVSQMYDNLDDSAWLLLFDLHI